MCDDLTEKDIDAYFRRNGLSRRTFGQLGAGAALMAMLPPVANAVDVVGEDVTVPTPDGTADAYFVHPTTGAHAAVMLWPSIVGIRETFRALGRRLAESGYAVLVVNPYYRTQSGPVIPEDKGFRDPGIRDVLMPFARTLSPATCVTDGEAYVSWLDQQDAVDASRKIGSIGYCMTGSYGLRLAAAIPGRVGAGASFHGGGLATPAEDSPHLLAAQMQAGFLIAIAANDDQRNPVEKDMLRKAFDEAGVEAEIEVYKDTLHGWCVPDSDVYHEAQAERAWSRMLALFEKELA
jgi:carboxymethylenebutenolidase